MATFDPFPIVPISRRSKTWHSAWLLGVWPITIMFLVFTARFEDVIGSRRDFMPFRDTKAALGAPDVTHVSVGFPLARDFTSIYLISVICLTVAITHSQWRRMSEVPAALTSAGVLRVRDQARLGPEQGILGIRRTIRKHKASQELPIDTLLQAANRRILKMGRLTPALVIIAFLGSLAVALGQKRNGIYSAFYGEGNPASTVALSAYDSWWANFDHPATFALYYVLLAVGIYLVLVQNTVGLIAIWTILGLNATYEFHLDYTNADGNFGWSSVSSVYRTVLSSLALQGSALGFTMIALGGENWPWVASMIAVWCVMLPATTVGPLVVFRGLNRSARAKAIQEISSTWPGRSRAEVAAEIDQVRRAKAHPLRPWPGLQFSAFFLLILWPLVLTLIQVYFSVRGTK